MRSVSQNLGFASLDNEPSRMVTTSNKFRSLTDARNQALQGLAGDINDSSFADSSGTNYQLELNKLLKCNFTGVPNLYWCDAGN